mmetsp:Transcript_36977/g.98519  ORF Transcript_36977/g.98519 Transcript_36977/m.98519 type:complete len:276 (-) Transcript_36977:1092-1919(-)
MGLDGSEQIVEHSQGHNSAQNVQRGSIHRVGRSPFQKRKQCNRATTAPTAPQSVATLPESSVRHRWHQVTISRSHFVPQKKRSPTSDSHEHGYKAPARLVSLRLAVASRLLRTVTSGHERWGWRVLHFLCGMTAQRLLQWLRGRLRSRLMSRHLWFRKVHWLQRCGNRRSHLWHKLWRRRCCHLRGLRRQLLLWIRRRKQRCLRCSWDTEAQGRALGRVHGEDTHPHGQVGTRPPSPRRREDILEGDIRTLFPLLDELLEALPVATRSANGRQET